MAEPVSYFDPDLIARLSGIRLRAAYVADGLVAGGFVSKRYGSSVEFADHKLYTPGDESRHIDWKLHARTDRYFVRRFEDESNRQFHFVLDASGSMKYRGASSPWSKWECASTIASALVTVSLSLGDSVGWTVSNTKSTEWSPATRLQQALVLFNELLQRADLKGQFDYSSMIQQLVPRLRRKSVVVILSDFMDPLESLESSLNQLLFEGHQLILLQVLDADEVDFPLRDGGRFVDLELQSTLTIDPLLIREQYLKSVEDHLMTLKSVINRLTDIKGICRLHQVITSREISPVLFSAFEQQRAWHG